MRTAIQCDSCGAESKPEGQLPPGWGMLLVESSKALPDPGRDLGRRYDLCPSCISLIGLNK